MPTLRRLAVLPLALLGAACSSPGTAPAADEPLPAGAVVATTPGGGRDERLVLSPGAAVMVADLRDPREVGPRDPVRITSARIDGDTLRVGVETGGGCRRHVFRLAVQSTFLESNPVQVHAALGHDADGDVCRALLRGDLAASLVPLADTYRRAYQTRTGVITIHLEGWSEPLRYTF